VLCQPDPVLRRVVEREVSKPGVLTISDAVFDPGVAAVAQFEVGELAGGSAGGGVGEDTGQGPGKVVGRLV